MFKDKISKIRCLNKKFTPPPKTTKKNKRHGKDISLCKNNNSEIEKRECKKT